MSCLPLSMFSAARALLRMSERAPTTPELVSLGAAVSLFASWFVAHPDFTYGVGVLSATHLGLFSQALGWHFLLWYFAALFYALASADPVSPRKLTRVAVSLALLLLVHSLTFVIACAFGFFFSALETRSATSLAKSCHRTWSCSILADSCARLQQRFRAARSTSRARRFRFSRFTIFSSGCDPESALSFIRDICDDPGLFAAHSDAAPSSRAEPPPNTGSAFFHRAWRITLHQ